MEGEEKYKPLEELEQMKIRQLWCCNLHFGKAQVPYTGLYREGERCQSAINF